MLDRQTTVWINGDNVVLWTKIEGVCVVGVRAQRGMVVYVVKRGPLVARPSSRATPDHLPATIPDLGLQHWRTGARLRRKPSFARQSSSFRCNVSRSFSSPGTLPVVPPLLSTSFAGEGRHRM